VTLSAPGLQQAREILQVRAPLQLRVERVHLIDARSTGQGHEVIDRRRVTEIDPAEELIVVFMTQLIPSGTFNFRGQLKSLVYSAIVD